MMPSLVISKLVCAILLPFILAKISCPYHLIARPSLRKPGSVDQNDIISDFEECLLSFIANLDLSYLSLRVTRKSPSIFEINLATKAQEPQAEGGSLSRPTPKPRAKVDMTYPHMFSFETDMECSSLSQNFIRPTPSPRYVSASTDISHHLHDHEIYSDSIPQYSDWKETLKFRTATLNVLSDEEVQEFEVNCPIENHQDYFEPSAPFEEDPWDPSGDPLQSFLHMENDVHFENQESCDYTRDYEMDTMNGNNSHFHAQETKWEKTLHLLKTMFEKGLYILRPHDDEPTQKQLLSSPELSVKISELFSTGFAAWTFTAEDNDLAGIYGGHDNKFITESNDGTKLFFGVTDGYRSSSVSLHSGSLSNSICHYAEIMIRETESQHSLSPLDLMRGAYRESILDSQVEFGSTAALFGSINEHRRMELCFSSTPWAAIFRKGEIFSQTHELSGPMREGYVFNKDPYLMRTDSSALVKQLDLRISQNIQQATWVLKKGDIVLAATNGLYKRMTSEQIAKSINISLRRGSNMQQASASLVEAAIGVLQVDIDETPYWIHSPEKNEDVMVVMIAIQ